MKRILCMLAIILLIGCGERLPIVGKEEIFVMVPQHLPKDVGKAVSEQIRVLVGNEASPGDRIHIVVFAESMRYLDGSFEVPEGNFARRLNDISVRIEVVGFAKLMQESARPVPSQLSIPELPSVVRSLRRTNLPIRMIVVGDPVYDDSRHAGWSMKKGKVPTDGSLKSDDCPFSAGVSDFPAGTKCYFLTLGEAFGIDHVHRSAIIRFYRLFFAEHKAELIRVTADPDVAFSIAGAAQFDDKPTLINEPAGMKQAMLRLSKEVDKVLESKPVPARSKSNIDPTDTSIATPVVPTFMRPELRALKGRQRRVAILVDHSLSMVKVGDVDISSRFVRVKADIQDKIRALPFDEFIVLGFGGDQEDKPRLKSYPWYLWNIGWAQASAKNRAEACQELGSWEAWGGTSTLPAFREVLKLRGLDTIILYTDGMPNIGGGQEEVLNAATAMKQGGIVINVIGVGSLSGFQPGNFDMAGAIFMQRLAEETDGAYFSLE